MPPCHNLDLLNFHICLLFAMLYDLWREYTVSHPGPLSLFPSIYSTGSSLPPFRLCAHVSATPPIIMAMASRERMPGTSPKRSQAPRAAITTSIKITVESSVGETYLTT